MVEAGGIAEEVDSSQRSATFYPRLWCRRRSHNTHNRITTPILLRQGTVPEQIFLLFHPELPSHLAVELQREQPAKRILRRIVLEEAVWV